MLLLLPALAGEPPPTAGERVHLGLGGGGVLRPASDPLGSGGEVHLRLGYGLTPGFDLGVELGRVEAPTREPGWYYQEWSPRVTLTVRVAPRHPIQGLLDVGYGAERVRVASRDPYATGGEVFAENPAVGAVAHVGPGLSLRLAGPAFLRLDGRFFVPFGPERADGLPGARPALELLAGLEIRPDARVDRDHDGLSDRHDACVRDPEDDDGFSDGDGCPDPDNDGDGVRDGADRCPADREDHDNHADDDGCADADNDADAVPDARDRCPRDAEDLDGFNDDDGCPELDNDLDGIPDRDDACVNDPERLNGQSDADGCPD